MTSAADPLLHRRPHRPSPGLVLWGEMHLALMRAHEICGRARRTLAAFVAAEVVRHSGGPVFWIAPSWQAEGVYAPGLTGLVDPGAVVFVAPDRAVDVLWSVEECLRAGCVPLVVAELPDLPGMVAVRRLHLAAEAGGAGRDVQPLALLLTPGEGGAPGIETRYSLDPMHKGGQARWRLARRRARMLPPCAWMLQEDALTPLPAE